MFRNCLYLYEIYRLYTGCSLNIVFLSKILKSIPDSDHSRFFLGVYIGLHDWTTKWRVKHQGCSRTGRVKILEESFKVLDAMRLYIIHHSRPIAAQNWRERGHLLKIRGKTQCFLTIMYMYVMHMYMYS